MLELLFTLWFTLELCVQVLAMGMYGHEHAYLSDPWHQLDAAIIMLSWLPLLFPLFGNYTAARALQALRPLRAIKRLRKLKTLVDTILDALPLLQDVVLLTGFVMVVWGTLGLQMFKGKLRHRCYVIGAAEPIDPQRGVCAAGWKEGQPNGDGSGRGRAGAVPARCVPCTMSIRFGAW